MQIKTFKAATINEALQLVKKELGPDAVILRNERVTVSPTQSYVEIMAATEPGAGDRTQDKKPGAELQVHDDIREIKSLLSMLISSKDYFTQLQIQQPLAEVYHGLLMRGLDEKQTFLLLKKALSNQKKDHARGRTLLQRFCRQLLKRIKLTNPFTAICLPNQGCSVSWTDGCWENHNPRQVGCLLKDKASSRCGGNIR